MKNLIKKISFWLNCARVYSLPITILNWLVVYIFSLKHGGNYLLGLIALLGTSLVHMATNLIDDYFDYKILIKDDKYLTSAQNCKCLYLKNKEAGLNELKNAIIIFLTIAAITGIILFFTSGYYVAILAIIGLCIALSYQQFSLRGLGEICVIIAYGPLLYEGIYYVMTGTFSYELLWISIACALFTNTILYNHMLMDFDGDECSHKTTLCRKFKTKNNALNFGLSFYIGAFIIFITLAIKMHNYNYFWTLITIPLIIDLYFSLKAFNEDKTNLPNIRVWHKPLDNWEKTKTLPDAPFYFRFFYSRNIVTFLMIILCIAIIL